MASRFSGFPPEGIRFLRALKRNNTREWFQPRKEQYDTHVKAPMLALISELNADLAKYAPEFVRDPKKSLFRIYRDVRFSADKKPYKTMVAASFRRHGTVGGGLYFSVSAEEIEVAGGVYHPDRDAMLAVRQHIAEKHIELKRLLAGRAIRKLCGEIQGGELSRAPKGFDPAHPALGYIKKKDWVLSVSLEASIATTPDLYREIAARFRAMIPFVEFIVPRSVQTKAQPADYW